MTVDTDTPAAILWIDGVGGFLVLRSADVSLGPAFADPAPDIAILADLSRHHATIRRDGESYWLSADKAASVNLTPAAKAHLRDGDRITLGASCQLLFAQPEPLSASARLTLTSGHRFAQPVDAVLLMAETLIIDRSLQAHIRAPDLTRRVVIHRQGRDFAVKAGFSIRTNGQSFSDRAMLTPGETCTIEDLAMTLEILPT
jgi:hypothetical protein